MLQLKQLLVVTILVLSLGGSVCLEAQEQKQVFVHYMPWYSSKPISGQWGWHWTMNKFKPDEGNIHRHEVASHFFPTIHLYDSGDPLLLEYHVQLMRLSGIDGVIIDWYGVSDFRDYGMIHRNTQALIKVIKQAGMKYAICYEDQTLKHRLAAKKIRSDEIMKSAQADFQWLEKQCFPDKSYVKLDGRPLLLVFGPQHLKLEQWKKLIRPANPTVLGLPHLSQKNQLSGAFGWPPVHGGKTVTPEQWSSYLDRLDDRAQKERILPVAFPGFKDIYQQAGVGDSYGFIDSRDGKTFAQTLDRALKSKTKLIQIATWNDFGEGTNIEPTWEYGFDYLKVIQERTKDFHNYRADDLRFPQLIYKLRKSNRDDKSAMKILNQHSNSLLKGDISAVRNGFPFDR